MKSQRYPLSKAMFVAALLMFSACLSRDLNFAQGSLLLQLLPLPAAAAELPEHSDKTLSPYFFVKSDDPAIDRLPLKSTAVTVDIAGVIADVRVTQVYRNEGKKPLEAIYVFPASTRAAVYGMRMTIGERTIIAKIEKREEARRTYEEAKQAGKSASLLEQQRPNVFQMNVANIMPGDEIKTELSYTELLTPTSGIYEFVYPTVVGPRYSSQPQATAPESEKWVENPYLRQGEAPTYTFAINGRLSAGLPVQEMVCSSHQMDIQYDDRTRARFTLAATEKTGGNRDVILKYRLSGEQIAPGLLLYEGQQENFFLLMLQPPARVAQNEIPAREYVFIVDVSGSMHGFPLDISKGLLKDLIGKLRPVDMFNVLLFAGGSQLLSPQSLPATTENIRQAVDLIDRQQGGGGTELLPALKRALALPHKEGTARTMVIATDGYVTVETEAFDLIRNELGSANFFTFGIGSSVNRFLIEGLARAGVGEPFVITRVEEAQAKAEKFRQYVLSPLLTRVDLKYEGFQAYDVEPAGVPDVFAERPLVVFGKWRGQPRGKITVRGRSGARDYEKTLDVTRVKPDSVHSALRYLWARTRIAELADYIQMRPDDERITEVTKIGLQYNLLTAYTSFVAVDTQVRRKDGALTTVKQPLPLPQGVSDYAVGGAARSAKLYAPMQPVPSALPSEALSGEADRADAQVMPKEAERTDEGKGRAEKNGEPHVSIAKITTTGGLSESEVRATIEKQLAGIATCLAEIKDLRMPTRIMVDWEVDGNGKVAKIKVVSRLVNAGALEKCLMERLKEMRFGAPANRKGAMLTVSFLVEG